MTTPPIRLLVAAPRLLDCLSLAALLRTNPQLHVSGAVTSLDAAIRHCHASVIDLLIIDVAFPDREAFRVTKALIGGHFARSALFLDTDLAIARVQDALEIPSSYYMTRDVDIRDIVKKCFFVSPSNPEACLHDRDPASRVFHDETLTIARRVDPPGNHVSPSIKRPHKWDTLSPLDEFGFLRLTSRERQVMEHLIRGYTVKEVGALMGLSHSTVDNHKNRLSRKLGIRNRAELMHIAVRTGIFDPAGFEKDDRQVQSRHSEA